MRLARAPVGFLLSVRRPLADAAGDAVDSATLRFLTAAGLKLREEEKVRKMLALNHRVGEGLSLSDAEWSAWRKWATSSSSSAGKRRMRKKREKNKTPKTSSSRAGSHSETWTLLYELFLVRLWRCHEFGGVWVFVSSWYVLASTAQRQFRHCWLVLLVTTRCHARRSCVWCLWSDSAENCGDFLVEVLEQGRSDFLSLCRGRSLWSRLFVGPKKSSCC